ncbi:hypothetical protein ACFQ7F_34465 [Streptomyces sp. NPDC056486]|uniref:hypothetical protein n=1 Tax=Streptomyces sp. NPDC056486 TaxID=3345835 RepID=UPI0036CDC883
MSEPPLPAHSPRADARPAPARSDTASRPDAGSGRRLPVQREEVRAVRERILGPASEPGAPAPADRVPCWRDLAHRLSELAATDPSSAVAVTGDVLVAELHRLYADPAGRDWLARRHAEGAVLALAVAPGPGPEADAPDTDRDAPVASVPDLTDWVGVVPADGAPDAGVTFVPAPRSASARRLFGLDGLAFTTLSPRTADSPPAHVLRVPDRADPRLPYEVLSAAVDVGVARAALAEGTAFLRERTRPWQDSGVESATDEPHTIRRYGELAATLHAVENLLEEAAGLLDGVRHPDTAAGPEPEPGAGTGAGAEPTESVGPSAELAVAELTVFARRATADVATGILELTGAGSTAERYGLDRHWRDLRAHGLVASARWTEAALGELVVTTAATEEAAV